MTRHSKNNTALGFFTRAEREKLKKDYGTIETRLDKGSIKNFDACCVCLRRANKPVCCEKGHIFCRECIVKYILGQKRKFKRIVQEYKHRKEMEKKSELDKNVFEKTREIDSFEVMNNSLIGFASTNKEQNETHKDFEDKTNPKSCFWGNQQISDARICQFKIGPNKGPETKPKKTPIQCPRKQGSKRHPIALRNIVNIHFTQETNPLCRICGKTLNNHTVNVACSPCGHVFCCDCVERIVLKEKKCFECSEAITNSIHLERGGIGFAAETTQNEAKKFTTPFILSFEFRSFDFRSFDFTPLNFTPFNFVSLHGTALHGRNQFNNPTEITMGLSDILIDLRTSWYGFALGAIAAFLNFVMLALNDILYIKSMQRQNEAISKKATALYYFLVFVRIATALGLNVSALFLLKWNVYIIFYQVYFWALFFLNEILLPEEGDGMMVAVGGENRWLLTIKKPLTLKLVRSAFCVIYASFLLVLFTKSTKVIYTDEVIDYLYEKNRNIFIAIVALSIAGFTALILMFNWEKIFKRRFGFVNDFFQKESGLIYFLLLLTITITRGVSLVFIKTVANYGFDLYSEGKLEKFNTVFISTIVLAVFLQLISSVSFYFAVRRYIDVYLSLLVNYCAATLAVMQPLFFQVFDVYSMYSSMKITVFYIAMVMCLLSIFLSESPTDQVVELSLYKAIRSCCGKAKPVPKPKALRSAFYDIGGNDASDEGEVPLVFKRSEGKKESVGEEEGTDEAEWERTEEEVRSDEGDDFILY